MNKIIYLLIFLICITSNEAKAQNNNYLNLDFKNTETISKPDSQSYQTYDEQVKIARDYLYTEGDTTSALLYFKQAISSIENPFFEHVDEFYQLVCATSKNDFIKTEDVVIYFKSEDDKNLFFKNSCYTENEVNSELIQDKALRNLVDSLYHVDQTIDRQAKNKDELFKSVQDEFKRIIEEYGFPTESKIGIYIDEKGELLTSPIYILIIHGIQSNHTYFSNNIEYFYTQGFITGSLYRFLLNLSCE